jgi:hypothetical protein
MQQLPEMQKSPPAPLFLQLLHLLHLDPLLEPLPPFGCRERARRLCGSTTDGSIWEQLRVDGPAASWAARSGLCDCDLQQPSRSHEAVDECLRGIGVETMT